jgi:hypothetical protein
MTNYNQFYSGPNSQFNTLKQDDVLLGRVYLGSTLIQTGKFNYDSLFTTGAIYDYNFTPTTANQSGWSGSAANNGFLSNLGAVTSSEGEGSYLTSGGGLSGLQSALSGSPTTSMYLDPIGGGTFTRTYQLWFKANNYVNGNFIVGNQSDAGGGGLNWFIHTNDANGVSFSGNEASITTQVLTTSSQWQNVAFTITKTAVNTYNANAYLNGVSVYNLTGGDLFLQPNVVNNMVVGSRDNQAGGKFNGYVGRVTTWNTILTDTQILNNYLFDYPRYFK